ncbi:MAG TPA: GGDEF domain-containing protein [Paraburkholderia sp.]|nr:GGDEF domain-containing protein [Paraburkholderia sp.]
MAAETSKTSTPILEPRRVRPGAAARAVVRLCRPGPATLVGGSLLCLLIGLLYVALQIKTVFSEQLKQEYAGLVIEAVDRAQGARSLVDAWQQMPTASAERTAAFQQARAQLTQRLVTLAALIDASPSAAPRMPASVLHPEAERVDANRTEANRSDTGTFLSATSSYWRAQRDADSADVRVRIAHVANALIAMAALGVCMLVVALAIYAKRTRFLTGQSREFEHAALHDPMTGLPNRRKLFATLEEAASKPSASRMAPAAAAPARLAVLYVDLDGFKQVNDSLGHRIGDEFLIAVSRRFRESVREGDVVARIGGDEFAVLVRGFSAQAELGEIAQRLIDCVTRTDADMGIGLVRASIGIASFPDVVEDYQRLVAAADDAMYKVKRGGKNGYAFVTRAN